MPRGTLRRPRTVRAKLAPLALALLLHAAPSLAAEDGKPGVLAVPENPKQAQDFFVEAGPLDARKVAVALRKGVDWLKRRQAGSGSWGGLRGNANYGGNARSLDEYYRAGPTALALYALLRARVPESDPVVRRGFAWLARKHKHPASSPETSMVLLALCATADKAPVSATTGKRLSPKLPGRYRAWAQRMREQLVAMRTARGWRYNYEGQPAVPGGPEDLASTWLAALALFEAQHVGLETPPAVWGDILGFVLDQQEEDGPAAQYVDPADPKKTLVARARGFAYLRFEGGLPDEVDATGGMTACGVATIAMAQFVLADGGRRRARWDEREDAARANAALLDGLAWLERNWQPLENPKKERFNVNHGTWWFALEAAMSLTAIKQIGTHPWFTELGQELVNRQRNDGHWDTATSLEPADTLDTCFALLALGRNAHELVPYPSVHGGSLEAPPDRP